ncbi:MAG TPA: hypothetical protein VH280_18385 [Verrucomicrobiae bacterium]|nr:hypothetical protein [Verrucomicrobiae bacterium]
MDKYCGTRLDECRRDTIPGQQQRYSFPALARWQWVSNLFISYHKHGSKYEFDILFDGPIDGAYILQASTNLTDWVPILTNGAPFVYTETNGIPQRYYRAVFMP